MSKDDFKKNALKDKKKIYKRIISYIPPVKMKLKYIDDEGNAEFRAEINSVFDICWYALARMIAANVPQQDENLENGGDKWKDGTLGVCDNFGLFFLKNNSVQKYCENALCKAARIRNNVRALRERRKQS